MVGSWLVSKAIFSLVRGSPVAGEGFLCYGHSTPLPQKKIYCVENNAEISASYNKLIIIYKSVPL
jgi:hypothetical protein